MCRSLRIGTYQRDHKLNQTMKTQREQLLSVAVSSTTKVAVGKAIAYIATKSLMRFGHPGLLAGDAVEVASRLVCDTCGVEDRTAETVSTAAGAGTTVVAGIAIGAVGGPVGMIVGAGTGFGFWVAGRVAGKAVSIAIDRSARPQ